MERSGSGNDKSKHEEWENGAKLVAKKFLRFLGVQPLIGSIVAGAAEDAESAPPFQPLKPVRKDDVVLAEGLSYQVLISWDTKINRAGDRFGFDNDYIAILPDPTHPMDSVIMW